MSSEDRGHSPLGGSGAERWFNCPGSPTLSRGAPDITSFEAAQGTMAHSIAQECLSDVFPEQDAHEFIGEVRTVEGHDIEFTAEDADAVQTWLDLIRGDVGPEDTLLVEQEFVLEEVDERCWGTSDAVIYRPGENLLSVRDYKHGSGKPVEVKGNKQLRYYALGAFYKLEKEGALAGGPVEKIELVICQPRCGHPDGPVRRDVIDILDLLEFERDLVEAVRRTDEEPETYVPGDWCRWCPAAGYCPALASQALEVAKVEFQPLEVYDPKELSAILDKLEMVEGFAKKVREFAFAELQAGKQIPGYKLVQKRATRKWTDAASAKKTLRGMGLRVRDIEDTKLKTPAQIEKQVGKSNMQKLEPYFEAVSSGLTLAPESDKRQAVLCGPEHEFTPIEEDSSNGSKAE